ncbi:MAG: hypothetical protein IKO35_03710 [Elusimicrobiaceae bacterium]|nr:hypothetical protein [Elusimicrobiaceae bacterium]
MYRLSIKCLCLVLLVFATQSVAWRAEAIGPKDVKKAVDAVCKGSKAVVTPAVQRQVASQVTKVNPARLARQVRTAVGTKGNTSLAKFVPAAPQLANKKMVPMVWVDMQENPLLRAVFQARMIGGKEADLNFTGTVFKTTYNGQEVFGVIASHAIADELTYKMGLHKVFLADVYVDGKFVTIPAEIVQLGAVEMLDVSLVKFRPEDEKLFLPFSISTTQAQEEDIIQTFGFSRKNVVYYPKRRVSKVATLTVRAPILGAGRFRSGLCGSAVLNEKNELVGVHCGSSLSINGDVGYAVRADFLNQMVAAYHQNPQAVIPFEINGQKIMDLPVNSYIARINLLDENKQLWARREFVEKFSYSWVEDNINQFPIRYMEIDVGQVEWSEKESVEFMREADSYVRYTYDLQTQEIIQAEDLPNPIQR